MLLKFVLYKSNEINLENIYILEDFWFGMLWVKISVFFSFVLYSIVVKLILCFLMIIFGVLLLKILDNYGCVICKKFFKLGVVMNCLYIFWMIIMLFIVMVLFLVIEFF